MPSPRMSAAVTSRIGKLLHQSPAMTADHSAIRMTDDPVADYTADREKKFRERTDQLARPVCESSAVHITLSSGSSLNHSRNAATP